MDPYTVSGAGYTECVPVEAKPLEEIRDLASTVRASAAELTGWLGRFNGPMPSVPEGGTNPGPPPSYRGDLASLRGAIYDLNELVSQVCRLG